MKKIRANLNQLSGIKTLILAVLFLNFVSLVSLYSSLHQAGEFVGGEIFFRQLTWILLSWLAFFLFNFINYRFYRSLALPIYAFSLLLIASVYFAGHKAMGAQRWLSFGGLTFQPSELAKVAIIILMAYFFSRPPRNSFFLDFCLPFSFVALSALAILNQPDLGSAVLIGLLAFLIGLFSKVKKKYFFLALIAFLAAAPFTWNMLQNYQRARLTAFINPNVDPLGSGYTIIQSKIAVGSGQFTGRGFLSGTQNQFNFLPERHTDFIFTVIAEEWGFLGSLALLIIYWLILKKILDKTKEVRDPFARQLILGIGIYFYLHIFINIGMALGVLPVVGLPLVFVSYGGSHLICSFILIGIFANICRSHG